MKKLLVLAAVAAILPASMHAQTASDGGITPEVLTRISKGYTGSPADKAVRNALAGTAINVLAANSENAAMIDTHFSDRVKTKGITDQKSSGRCWLFTGLNVLRARMIDKYNLGDEDGDCLYETQDQGASVEHIAAECPPYGRDLCKISWRAAGIYRA